MDVGKQMKKVKDGAAVFILVGSVAVIHLFNTKPYRADKDSANSATIGYKV